MNQTYWKVLNQKLVSPPAPSGPYPLTLAIQASLTPVITIKWVDPDGHWRSIAALVGGDICPSGVLRVYPGQVLVFQDSATGAFVSAIEVDPNALNYTLDATVLTAPNDIGPPPEPDLSAQILIPSDGPRIAVGVGLPTTPGGPTIVRYQRWRRHPASYELAATENRTVVMSQTVGRVESSSDLETVATSLDMSTTVGWGLVSSTISASLSQSSTTYHSLTISEYSSKFVTDNFNNKTGKDLYVLHWQLIDGIAIILAASEAIGALVEAALTPMIPRTIVLPAD